MKNMQVLYPGRGMPAWSSTRVDTRTRVRRLAMGPGSAVSQWTAARVGMNAVSNVIMTKASLTTVNTAPRWFIAAPTRTLREQRKSGGDTGGVKQKSRNNTAKNNTVLHGPGDRSGISNQQNSLQVDDFGRFIYFVHLNICTTSY